MEKFLAGFKVILGVCGGIAAYKAIELLRLLTKAGAEVKVAMTASAKEFIQPLSFQALSGNVVISEIWQGENEWSMDHIHWSRWADLIVIVPATANFIAKITHGLADDFLSTLCIASNVPIIFAPSMNQAMWINQATQHNVCILRERGFNVLPVVEGVQACKEYGPGRMLEVEHLFQFVALQLWRGNKPKLLKGLKIMITGGSTREPLDPVRYISNHSSGKMAHALAVAAFYEGADVCYISGPSNINILPSLDKNFIVETAREMLSAVRENIINYDIFIGAAAVTDFKPLHCNSNKLKKPKDLRSSFSIEFEDNIDIISSLRALKENLLIIGFAAETENLLDNAKSKLANKKLDMLVANQVGKDEYNNMQGFCSDYNHLQLFYKDGSYFDFPQSHKLHLALLLLQKIENYSKKA